MDEEDAGCSSVLNNQRSSLIDKALWASRTNPIANSAIFLSSPVLSRWNIRSTTDPSAFLISRSVPASVVDRDMTICWYSLRMSSSLSKELSRVQYKRASRKLGEFSETSYVRRLLHTYMPFAAMEMPDETFSRKLSSEILVSRLRIYASTS